MQRIEVTEELLYSLYCAALNHVKMFLIQESETIIPTTGDYAKVTISRPSYRDRDYVFHDDSHDDLSAALEIAEFMRGWYYDACLMELSKFLNTPHGEYSDGTELQDFACGGIAQAFYDLDCPALPKDIY